MSRQPRVDATLVRSINGWNLERMLGSGGFGAVHLFRNEVIVIPIRHLCSAASTAMSTESGSNTRSLGTSLRPHLLRC